MSVQRGIVMGSHLSGSDGWSWSDAIVWEICAEAVKSPANWPIKAVSKVHLHTLPMILLNWWWWKTTKGLGPLGKKSASSHTHWRSQRILFWEIWAGEKILSNISYNLSCSKINICQLRCLCPSTFNSTTELNRTVLNIINTNRLNPKAYIRRVCPRCSHVQHILSSYLGLSICCIYLKCLRNITACISLPMTSSESDLGDWYQRGGQLTFPLLTLRKTLIRPYP